MERRQDLSVEELFGLRMVGVISTGPTPALPDLIACRLQHFFVGGILPLNQILDDTKEPLALLVLLLLCREEVGISRRVIDHLGEDNRSRRSERTTRPVEM